MGAHPPRPGGCTGGPGSPLCDAPPRRGEARQLHPGRDGRRALLRPPCRQPPDGGGDASPPEMRHGIPGDRGPAGGVARQGHSPDG